MRSSEWIVEDVLCAGVCGFASAPKPPQPPHSRAVDGPFSIAHMSNLPYNKS